MPLHFSLKTFVNFALWIQWAFRRLPVPYLNGAIISSGWIHILGLCWITTECMQVSLKTIIWLCSTIWWKGRSVRVQPNPNITSHTNHNHEITENVAVFPVICLCWIVFVRDLVRGRGRKAWIQSVISFNEGGYKYYVAKRRNSSFVLSDALIHPAFWDAACGIFGSGCDNVLRWDISVSVSVSSWRQVTWFAGLHRGCCGIRRTHTQDAYAAPWTKEMSTKGESVNLSNGKSTRSWSDLYLESSQFDGGLWNIEPEEMLECKIELQELLDLLLDCPSFIHKMIDVYDIWCMKELYHVYAHNMRQMYTMFTDSAQNCKPSY